MLTNIQKLMIDVSAKLFQLLFCIELFQGAFCKLKLYFTPRAFRMARNSCRMPKYRAEVIVWCKKNGPMIPLEIMDRPIPSHLAFAVFVQKWELFSPKSSILFIHKAVEAKKSFVENKVDHASISRPFEANCWRRSLRLAVETSRS